MINSIMVAIRIRLFLAAALAFISSGLIAQTISGTITDREPMPDRIVLLEVLGSDHRSLDSVRIDGKGRFLFPFRSYQLGFYKLSLNDSDQVDLILSPREKNVQLHFDGEPLQEHISVISSDENRRMWSYKQVSRRTLTELNGLRAMRERSDPMDGRALRRIDSLEASVEGKRSQFLDSTITDDPTSYFTYVVLSDRKLMASIPNGGSAIKSSFNWADGVLVRSSLYPKAMMAYLQSIPFDAPGGLQAGVDSLLRWAEPDTICWRYARSLLMRLFDQYGPDDVAQHIVDRYMTGPGTLLPVEIELRSILGERLRVAVGATAPDVRLADPLSGDTVELFPIVQQFSYTVLFFYSSTCDHCHEQMPGLRALYEEYHRSGLQVLGIALDVDMAEFRTTIEERDLPWPGYSELNGWGSAVAKAFAVKSTPHLVLIDREGTIMARPSDHSELRSILVPQLK